MADEAQRSSVQPGDEIAGKYRVDRVLGQGGMGVVLAATHALTHQRVALKLLLRSVERSPEQEARFMNEARAAVQIQSEHVARVTDVDRLPSGEPYIVMEYLEGQDLGALVQARGPLPLEEVLDYVLQGCEALAEAHVLGIVHRDLKPANLFLTHRRDRSPLVKVLDFGISRLGDTAGPGTRLTQTRGAMGSPLYMSPEQLMTPKDVDARADIWALGVVLFELLTGTWPFEAETMEGLVVEIATKPPRALRTLRPDAPVAVEQVIARCLQKSRHERYASIAELAQALAPSAARGSRLSVDRISRVFASAPQPSVASPALTIDPLRLPADATTGRVSLGGTAVMASPSSPTPVSAPVPGPPSADPRSGTRSLEPTAQTLGDGPGQQVAGVPAARRWPLAAGALVVAGVAAVFAFTRSSPSSATASPPPSNTAAVASIAVTSDAVPTPASSPVPTPIASATATAPSVPATSATGTRVAVKGGKAASPGGLVAAVPAAVPPAVAPPPKSGGPADFGGK